MTDQVEVCHVLHGEMNTQLTLDLTKQLMSPNLIEESEVKSLSLNCTSNKVVYNVP